MKKFFIFTAVCAGMFLMISCGGSSSSGGDKFCGEFYANGECNGHDAKVCSEGDNTWYEVEGTGKKFYCDKDGQCEKAAQDLVNYCFLGGDTDTDTDTGDSGSEGGNSDTDTGDSDTENPDQPDTGDEEECMVFDYQCRDGNSYKCNLDLAWELAEECVNGCKETNGKCYPELRDCSDSEKEVCLDKKTGVMWSKKSEMMNWENAGNYCENLEENSFDDWRLPTIDELRTLILSCDATVTGGTCPVSAANDVLSSDSWSDDCHCEDAGTLEGYTKFGEEDYYEFLWSSSEVSDKEEMVWILETRNANIRITNKDETNLEVVRCVRNAD